MYIQIVLVKDHVTAPGYHICVYVQQQCGEARPNCDTGSCFHQPAELLGRLTAMSLRHRTEQAALSGDQQGSCHQSVRMYGTDLQV